MCGFVAVLNPSSLPHNPGVVTCFEKVGPSVLVYLSERTLKLASPKLGSDEVRVFCDMQQEKLFTDYRIESLANNSILFEVRAYVVCACVRYPVPHSRSTPFLSAQRYASYAAASLY